MVLVHYSDRPLTVVKSASNIANIGMRPKGLWVSVDNCPDNWADWCRAEQQFLETLQFPTRILLRPDVNILVLDTTKAIMEFHRKYAVPRTVVEKFQDINWELVAGAHEGIVIAPYDWNLRMKLHWYYGWDAAAGVIWTPRAVASVGTPKASAELSNLRTRRFRDTEQP
jgi:hypothetical protein